MGAQVFFLNSGLNKLHMLPGETTKILDAGVLPLI